MSERILIIDDEEAIRQAMKTYFGLLGYYVEIASSVEEAEETVSRETFDLVITDLRLARDGGYQGLDIVRFVRRISPNTANIILTAYGSPAVERQAEQLGVERFLHKPVALAKLSEDVKILLEKRKKTEGA